MRLLPFEFRDWPWGGEACSLALYSNVNWTDVDGDYHLAGKPGSLDFFQLFPGTVAGRVASFENGINTPSTTLAQEHTDTMVRVTAVLRDSLGTPRKTVWTRWVLPDDLDPETHAQLAVYQRATKRRRMSARYLDRDQTYAAIAEALSSLISSNGLAAESGIAEMDEGEVVVENALVTAVSRILAYSVSSGVDGVLYVPQEEIVAGESFTIRSNLGANSGSVIWLRYEP